jgi:hypothetical protein
MSIKSPAKTEAPSEKPVPLAVLQGTAKILVSHEPEGQEERTSTDVIAFCALLARIIMRCLKEQDEQVLDILSLSSHQSRKE